MNIIFKNIRNDMEFATDEMAIGELDAEEKRKYCKVMVEVASMYNSKNEVLLGLSNGAKYLEKRIDMISLKDKFEENHLHIAISTIFIIVLICSVLYPTSYGEYDAPELYLELENGDIVETTNMIEKEQENINQVKLNQDSEIKLIVKGGKPNNYIFYNKIDLDTMNVKDETVNISSGKISYFDIGNYIYEFTLTYGNNQSVDYAIKIIVE
jgi:hypothetical protein